MAYLQQVSALLKIQRLRYERDLSEHLRQFFFPLIIAFGVFFFSRVTEGSELIAIYLPWGYNGFVRNIFVDIVTEKQSKHREYYKINGLTRSSYYSAHMILAVLKGLVVAFILLLGFIAAGSSFVPSEYWFILFIVLELQAIANALFSFTISVFFEDPFIGSDIIGTLFGTMGFFYFVGSFVGSRSIKIVCGLLPPSAVTQGILGTALGDSSFTLIDSFWMLILDIAILFVVFFLCDTFYGIDKETTSDYWKYKVWLKLGLRRRKIHISDEEVSTDSESSSPRKSEASFDSSSASFHEKFPHANSLKKTIQIEHLKKRYGKAYILNGVSLSIYEKQIFCLLGHNGAGKTTSINILTGFSKATSGSVYYYGKNFRKFYNETKKKIGVCPQTDLCLPFLTCEENLDVLAKIRGIPADEMNAEIEAQLKKVGLYDNKHKFSKQLSGGNRRKLSMAMALMGGTEILYFDEPTSAMDPTSRRIIWQIIKDLRKEGKTIVLTTHYLEEADELADRIGVMQHGNLFAVGSPNYIKKEFGVGYHLIISPQFGHEATHRFEELKPQMQKIIEAEIEGAEVKDKTAPDIFKVLLPFNEQKKFAGLFEKLETIDGIVLSLEMNSLEDAFLNITMKEADKNHKSVNVQAELPLSARNPPTFNFWSQFEACAYKRSLTFIRSPQGYFSIIQPLAFILTASILPQAMVNREQKIASFVAFVMAGLVANTSIYCGSVVYDREKRIKYILRVMGCKNSAYWLGCFVFDFCVISCFVILLLVLCNLQDIDFVTENMGTFIGLIFGFVSSLITTAYLWGNIYSSSVAASSTYPVFALVVIYLAPLIASAVFNAAGVPELSSFSQAVGYILGPCLPFQQGMFAANPSAQGNIFGLVLVEHPGWVILILFVQAIVYMALAVQIEANQLKMMRKIKKNKRNNGLEVELSEKMHGLAAEDVEAELDRVTQEDNHDPIKVVNLKKVYKDGHVGLKGISFGVEKGQIFGLLGPNGAGKSTAFNIMTQLVDRTDGQVSLNSKSLNTKNPYEIYKSCGICPQFDALWDLLTVGEHLEIFSKIKGLHGLELKETVNYFLEILKIGPHKDKKTCQLSGGNKRRLCVALASLGAPTIQFMDEPSTGMDPLARILLWDVIKQNLSTRDSSIVLTTHSMMEAESLCSKIGILVNGSFVCIGNVPYLKSKYGTGYKITVSKGPQLDCDTLDLIKEISPQATKTNDSSDVYETFQIPHSEFQFSRAFSKLEKFKLEEKLKDFSIYNTTLEQVFLEFSKAQHVESKKSE